MWVTGQNNTIWTTYPSGLGIKYKIQKAGEMVMTA